MKWLLKFVLVAAILSQPAFAWRHGYTSSFNGGKVQANFNFTSSGGFYPFINFMKMSTSPKLVDNSGYPSPADVDANGYLISGSNAEAHGGIYSVINIPSIANNGAYYVYRATGKGTLLNFGNNVVSTTACSITTGAPTTISCTPGAGPFSGLQDFRSGMEVPISGTTGVTVTNGPGGSITANVYTVCPGYIVGANTFTLCLNDQITPVQTSGTAGGTTTITYGRLAVGVAISGRVVLQITTDYLQLSPVGIASQNASTPITDVAVVTQGSEERRYELGCPDCIFSSKFLSILRNGSNIGVLRALDPINTNTSSEVRWADRRPLGYISYDHDMFNRSPSVFVSGGTTNSGNDYTATFSAGAAPTAGQQLVLTFNASQTSTPATVTFSNGSKTVNWTSNGLSVGDPVACLSTSSLPTPLYPTANFYVTTAAANSIEMAWTPGGTAITMTSAGSGTHQCVRQPTITNGSGAVPIRDSYGAGLGLLSSSRKIAAATYGTMTYDAVLGSWLKSGADTSLGNGWFPSGWPPEVFLRLCIAVGAHPWFTPPQFSVDSTSGISDYMPSLAAYVKANKPSWMIPRFEVWPNELWNNQFPATSWGRGHANTYANSANPTGAYAGWATGDLSNFAGKVGSVVGQAINIAFGSVSVDGTTYQTMAGIQTGAFQGSTTGGSTDRMTSADYVAQTPPAQSGYTKSAASGWVTHITNAIYVTPGLWGTGTETTLAAAYKGGFISASVSGSTLTVSSVRSGTNPIPAGTVLTGNGIPTGTTVISGTGPYTIDRTFSLPRAQGDISTLESTSDATAPQTYIDSFSDAGSSLSVPGRAAQYANIATFAGVYSKRCAAYEGGYGADYDTAGWSVKDQLRYGGKITTSSPNAAQGVRTYIAQNLANYKAAGCEFPSLFQLTGKTPSNNPWSALEDIYQTTPAPYWDAYTNYNFLLKRDLDPASNDNDPMWLEKAA